MDHPYDWGAIVRAAWAFGPADLDRLLDQALQAGRLLRDQEIEETEEIEEAAKSEPAH